MLIRPATLTKHQKTTTVEKLFEDSAPSYTFFLMLAFSTLIATLGLLLHNIAIIIGGMLVTPLLSPMLSLAMGVVVADQKLIKRSSGVIFQSVIAVITLSLLISLLAINKDFDSDLFLHAAPNLPYLVIALISGAAVAYAIAQPALSATLPGVAIAVALLPPLATVGLALSGRQWELAVNSFSLFILNLVSIILAAVAVFSMLNFHDVKQTIVKKIKAEERSRKQAEALRQQADFKQLEQTVKAAEKIIKAEKVKKKK